MANTVSALKRVRMTERRTAINRMRKSRLRHQIRTMRKALASKEQKVSAQELQQQQAEAAQEPPAAEESAPADNVEEVQAGELRYLELQEMIAHPIALALMVRARGALDTFPSLVVEELRKAMPRLDPADAS